MEATACSGAHRSAQQTVTGRLRPVIPPERIGDSRDGDGHDDDPGQHENAGQPGTVAPPHHPSVPPVAALVLQGWDRNIVDGESQGAYTFSP